MQATSHPAITVYKASRGRHQFCKILSQSSSNYHFERSFYLGSMAAENNSITPSADQEPGYELIRKAGMYKLLTGKK
jgi:hypothetical protein